MAHLTAFAIAATLAIVALVFGHPWLGLVAFVGPIMAWVLSIVGISGAVIISTLSGGGAVPIVAGVGIITWIALAIYSIFV